MFLGVYLTMASSVAQTLVIDPNAEVILNLGAHNPVTTKYEVRVRKEHSGGSDVRTYRGEVSTSSSLLQIPREGHGEVERIWVRLLNDGVSNGMDINLVIREIILNGEPVFPSWAHDEGHVKSECVGDSVPSNCPRIYGTSHHIIPWNNVEYMYSNLNHPKVDTYHFGRKLGAVVAEVCGDRDIDECLLNEKSLAIQLKSLPQTPHFSWTELNPVTGHIKWNEFECMNRSSKLEDCLDGQDAIRSSVLLDTINHDGLHQFDPERNYSVVSCKSGATCNQGQTYIRGPFPRGGEAALYRADTFCDSGTGAGFLDYHPEGLDCGRTNAIAGTQSLPRVTRAEVEDLWPVVHMNLTLDDGSKGSEPFIVGHCQREVDLGAFVDATRSSSNPTPAVGRMVCDTTAAAMQALSEQFTSPALRKANLRAEYEYALAQGLALEGVLRGVGWAAKGLGKLGGLKTQRGIDALGRTASGFAHTGLNGYLLVSGAVELGECDDSACYQSALVQIGLAALALGHQAYHSQVSTDVQAILDDVNAQNAGEIQPLLQGVRDGYELSSAEELGSGLEQLPARPHAETPSPEVHPDPAIAFCPL